MRPPYSSARDQALHHLCKIGYAAAADGALERPSGLFWLLHVAEPQLRQAQTSLLDAGVSTGNRQALLGDYVVVETSAGVWVHEHCDGDMKPAEARAQVRFAVMQRDSEPGG